MSDPKPAYAFPYDLASLPQGTTEVRLAPSPEARAAVAAWLGATALETLSPTIRLSRLGEESFVYRGRLEADIVQACVVTLEPVHSHVVRDVERHFRLAPARRSKARIVDYSLTDDDETDLVTNSVIDLAAPMLEELSLSVDPYPRVPGASFVPPATSEAPPENPFAPLEKLKSAPPAASKPRGKSR